MEWLLSLFLFLLRAEDRTRKDRIQERNRFLVFLPGA